MSGPKPEPREAPPGESVVDGVRASDRAIDALERSTRDLAGDARRAIGFSDEPIPPLRREAGTPGAHWPTLGRLFALGLTTMFFGLGLITFDSRIARTLRIADLGFASPSGFQTLYPPILVLFTAIAAFATAGLVARRPCRGLVAGVAAAVIAGALVLAAVATTEWGLIAAVALGGTGIGARATVSAPLLFDRAPPGIRFRVVSLSVATIAGGGALGAGLIALCIDALELTWQDSLLVLGAVASMVALAAIGLRDSGVGEFDLDEIDALVHGNLGASPEPSAEDTSRLSGAAVRVRFGEQLRHVTAVRTVPLMMLAFLTFGIFAVPLQGLLASFYVARWHLDAADRAWLFAGLAIGAVVALALFMRQGERWLRAAPRTLLSVTAGIAVVAAAGLTVAAMVHVFALMVAGLVVLFAGSFLILTTATVVMLSVVDPHLRSHAAALAGAAVAGGVLTGSAIPGELASRYGLTTALVFLAVNSVVLAIALRGAASTVDADLDQLVEREIEREELRVLVGSGQKFPLLGCRHIDFAYGQLQVLFDVSFTIDDGEIVALLGTNGAGKSTLLRAISGLAPVARGTIHYRGADITHVEAERRCELGITELSGGRAVFGPMSVVDNLRTFAFSQRRQRGVVERGIDATFEAFPQLAARRNQLAATLSGGEQQMLALGKAFILHPRLLLIDELSLGLAPIVVSQLLEMVRRINREGASVVLVEQSVNIALSVVEHAYFMEKGEMRFDGSAAELIDRPDLVRSVFLDGASRNLGR